MVSVWSTLQLTVDNSFIIELVSLNFKLNVGRQPQVIRMYRQGRLLFPLTVLSVYLNYFKFCLSTKYYKQVLVFDYDSSAFFCPVTPKLFVCLFVCSQMLK